MRDCPRPAAAAVHSTRKWLSACAGFARPGKAATSPVSSNSAAATARRPSLPVISLSLRSSRSRTTLSSATRLDDDVRSAVEGPTCLGGLGADRALLAVAHRAHASGRDAERHEVVHGRPGAPIAEREVVFVGATFVALPLDEDQHVVRLEPGRVGL